MDFHTDAIPAPLKLGQGPGLLLAHGAGSDIQDSYGPVIERLAAVSTVVGPDLPGSGNCPLPQGPLTLDGTADHLVASAVRAGVESFAISGFSLGTAVAVRAATRHPERVTGLILSAGFACPDSRLRLVIDTWRALLRDTGNSRTLASYLSLVVGGPQWLDERTPEEIEEQLAQFATGMPAGADAQLALFDHIDVREDLRSITVPTLVVSPSADLIATPPSLTGARRRHPARRAGHAGLRPRHRRGAPGGVGRRDDEVPHRPARRRGPGRPAVTRTGDRARHRALHVRGPGGSPYARPVRPRRPPQATGRRPWSPTRPPRVLRPPTSPPWCRCRPPRARRPARPGRWLR